MPFIMLTIQNGPGEDADQFQVRVNSDLIKTYFMVPDSPLSHQTVVEMVGDDRDKEGNKISIRCADTPGEIDHLIYNAEHELAKNRKQA
jgi:hypothetical protein